MTQEKQSKNPVETTRYSRQQNFSHIGAAGQRVISAARVVVIGCGALGSVSADLLARAGVGKLLLVDRDIVELSNLQRQTLYTEADVRQGMPKAEAARGHLQEVNSDIEIAAEVADLSWENATRLLSGATLIVDGTDNFETRQLINDAAIQLNLPWVYGGAVGADGMVKGVLPGESSCFRCLMDELPGVGESPTCETAGIIAPASVSVAALQVSVALKYLVTGEMDSRLHLLDLWQGSHRTVAVPRLENCSACVAGRLDYLKGTVGGRATELCGRNTVQVSPARAADVDIASLAGRLETLGAVTDRKYYLMFDDGELQLSIFPDGRVMVHGTSDERRARAAVARYLGG